nr:hypothetical protein [Rhodococcus sp. ARC_M6]
MMLKTAALTPENRLTLAILRTDMTTLRALLGRVRGRNLGD